MAARPTTSGDDLRDGGKPTASGTPGARVSRETNFFIQYLRGYASLMVVLDHSMLTISRDFPTLKWLEPLAGDLGALGVRIFFVISGYIMVAISYDAFRRPGSTRKFWLSRIERIAPAYYIATALVILLPLGMGGHPPFTPGSIIGSLLFLPVNARPAEMGLLPVLGAGWTLVYEMFFYFLFGISLLFPRRIGLALTPIILVLLIGGGHKTVTALSLTNTSPFAYYTNTIMVLFACGMFVAMFQKSRFFRRLDLPAPATIGVGLPLVAVLILNVAMPDSYPAWRSLLIYGLSTLAVLLCVIARPRPPAPALARLGDASFSLYLFHPFAMRSSVTLWTALFGFNMPLARMCVSILASVVGGFLAYRFIEQPIVRLLKPRSRQVQRDAALDTTVETAPPAEPARAGS